MIEIIFASIVTACILYDTMGTKWAVDRYGPDIELNAFMRALMKINYWLVMLPTGAVIYMYWWATLTGRMDLWGWDAALGWLFSLTFWIWLAIYIYNTIKKWREYDRR